MAGVPAGQMVWLGVLMAWSLMMRIALRRGLLLPDAPRLMLLACDEEMAAMHRPGPGLHLGGAWSLSPTAGAALKENTAPLLVALSPGRRRDPSLAGLIECLEMRDPRLVQTTSVISCLSSSGNGLPWQIPFIVRRAPWAAPFSVQAQLKRLADLHARPPAASHSPLHRASGSSDLAEDQGPVFYSQQPVAGWGGRSSVLKLRTMREQPADESSLWTKPGDQRITVVGQWLRRLRLDELPQLLNVLNGEMSLIGPPERPELEHELERHIPITGGIGCVRG